MKPITDDQRRATFDYYLRRAIFFGEWHEVSCVGLTCQTWQAIHVVTSEYPNVTFESVLLARNELERQLDGRQSDEAMARYPRKKLPAMDLTTCQRKRKQFANVAPTTMTVSIGQRNSIQSQNQGSARSTHGLLCSSSAASRDALGTADKLCHD